mgnify:CR=1 FL=1
MSPKVHFMQGMFLYGEMEDILNEVAPPGFGHTKSGKGDKKGGTAAAFKRALDRGDFKGLPGSKTKKEKTADMFKIMWAQKKKGAKPHYKPGTDKKYKKYQEEETTYKQRDKELKKTSAARNQRYKDLHKKTGTGNVDINESQYEKLKKKIGSKKMHTKPAIVNWRDEFDYVQEGAAWTKKSGKNPEGGLNEKGRKSYERENPGSDLKAPQPEGGSRKKSFCARMGGMKKKLTSAKTANDPDSRINKALRKWKC